MAQTEPAGRPGLATNKDRLAELHAAFGGAVLVPTMGAIHEGHLALVRRAREIANSGGLAVCVSIFVNPIQFSPDEDLDSYPRRLDGDLDAISGLADTCYAPGVKEMYPDRQEVFVHAPEIGSQLCGAHRPGHFQGVLTVVHKLLFAVSPKAAVFGEKDYQQLVLIRKMVKQLGPGVAIESVPTVRESDGLALSSRNEGLRGKDRETAPKLHEALRCALEKILSGIDEKESCDEAASKLVSAGFEVDYIECRALDLSEYKDDPADCVVLGAARIGGVRLIDNVRPDPSP